MCSEPKVQWQSDPVLSMEDRSSSSWRGICQLHITSLDRSSLAGPVECSLNDFTGRPSVFGSITVYQSHCCLKMQIYYLMLYQMGPKAASSFSRTFRLLSFM
ncbi:hypothetical protein NPIL_491211 [Nephila pilipes]|uniref:Uncharacterized protein n=1 Tax=Nephila pilipes TaxID=299642 RepID=A0A8X6TC69_NEPPI|nr:hypothetical protein NPIL_491211 [Nephila pilipes]